MHSELTRTYSDTLSKRNFPFPFSWSLSARLLVTCVVALAVSLGTISAALIYLFEHYPNETLGRLVELQNVARLATAVRFDALGRPVSVALPPDAAALFTAFPGDYSYRIVDEHDQTILLSGPLAGPFSDPRGFVIPENNGLRTTRERQIFHVVTAPIDTPENLTKTAYFAQVASSENFDAMMIHDRLVCVPDVAGITFILAVLVFMLALRQTLRSMLQPLHKVSRAAADISPRTPGARLSLAGIPGELQPLIKSFNAALERLELGYLSQQNFLACAAHELQTPLALIRGQIELQAQRDGKERLLQDVDLMARQVRQLLQLTEVCAAQNYVFSLIDISEVVDDVVRYLGRIALSKKVSMNVQTVAGRLEVLADKSAMFILLKNLLENALSVAPPQSEVTLLVSADMIAIRDNGAGIDAHFMPHIFDRFWRAPGASYEGAGLGLAICKEIATTHGWWIAVKPRKPGTCFVLYFFSDGRKS